MNQPIPALSVQQPWAELIITGQKTIELRTWAPEYRGQVCLHAGKRINRRLEEHFGLENLFRGGFIGTVELTAIVPIRPDRWRSWRERHRDPGPYQPGMFGWILKNPHRFDIPVPGRGALGLFIPSPELQERLRQATAS